MNISCIDIDEKNQFAIWYEIAYYFLQDVIPYGYARKEFIQISSK